MRTNRSRRPQVQFYDGSRKEAPASNGIVRNTHEVASCKATNHSRKKQSPLKLGPRTSRARPALYRHRLAATTPIEDANDYRIRRELVRVTLFAR